MSRVLNLNDIQGNIVRAYGRYSFPFARYFFFHIHKTRAGCQFVANVTKEITTAARWNDDNPKPKCTTNIAFTYKGLHMLDVPGRTLQGMSNAFSEGMKNRGYMLGDRPENDPEQSQDWYQHWDKIWRDNRHPDSSQCHDVHIWISLNAQLESLGTDQPVPELEEKTQWLKDLCKQSEGGVSLITTIGQDGNQPYQAASAIFEDYQGVKVPSPKEYFGFTDGIGDPVFKGQYNADEEEQIAIGRGKRMQGILPPEDISDTGWEPLATGEFVLGHVDESQEIAPMAAPTTFSHNGSYMAFRKLHENVGSFKDVLKAEAETYMKVMDVDLEEATETLMAKMCGRWSDGVPLAKIATYAEWQDFREEKGFNDPNPMIAFQKQIAYIRSPEASNFRFGDDMLGHKCPVGSHLRRMNTRDHLDPSNQFGIDPKTGKQFDNPNANSSLNKRRRILRRGLPYGPGNFNHPDDSVEQGVAMMLVCADLFRQFEFVQQQWVQYGLDFNQGNNTCPLIGNHSSHQRHVIPADPKSGKPPYIMSKLKNFVECRGGEYFFIPSLTSLNMIAMGTIDPT